MSESKMAPFTQDFRKAQQRMPAIPVHIHHVNFTWQVTDDQVNNPAAQIYSLDTLHSLSEQLSIFVLYGVLQIPKGDFFLSRVYKLFVLWEQVIYYFI